MNLPRVTRRSTRKRDRYPIRREKKNPAAEGANPGRTEIPLCTFTNAAPRMAGGERRKEYFALREGETPGTSPSVTAEPDRESPGNTAAPCITPMASASQA